MSGAQPSLLPGQSAPVSIITANDKGGLVLIVTALGLAFVLVSLIIRAYVRLELSPRSFAWDDWVVGIAAWFSIFQNVAVFIGVHRGFGRRKGDISPPDLVAIQKAQYASDILYIIVLYLTKCSVAFLFLRLSPDHRHILASKVTMLVSGGLAAISVMIVALRCHLSHPWMTIDAQCPGLFARWQVVAAFDITTEIALFAIAVYMVQGLRMSLYRKFIVAFAFGLRLPVIAASAFRLHYVSATLSSSDPTLTGNLASICTQIEISFAIIAATIPCLRVFMTATATNYGAPPHSVRSSHGTHGRSSGHIGSTGKSRSITHKSFGLSSLSSKLRSRTDSEKNNSSFVSANQSGTTFEGVYTGNPLARNDASATGGARSGTEREHSLESSESKRMIIRKDVDYAVQYEDKAPEDPIGDTT